MMENNEDNNDLNHSSLDDSLHETFLPKKSKESNNNEQDDFYAVFINNPTMNDPLETNIINTSKYQWYNFFAKILMEQFSRMANVYFLIIAVLQSSKEITNTNGTPVVLLPLTMVVTLNGIKDLYENHKRKKSDNEENNSNCLVYDNLSQDFISKKWSQVKLGEIIKVRNNEPFPADLILLGSSDENGICYVETKNLDGETNLKFQESNEILQKKVNDKDLSNIKYACITKQPNEFIYKFDATLYETDNDGNIENKNNYIILNKNQLLLRGCFLRQTEYIIGAAIYIGQHTKSMMNSPDLKAKHSSVEKIMNRLIVLIFIIQFSLAMILSILYIILYHVNFDNYKKYFFPELGESKENILWLLIEFTFVWFLVCSNFVPISLLTTMECTKFLQAMFMEYDIDMYIKKDMSGCKVQSSTLNEELGQIKYIFCDKTGTLTKNYMIFKMMSIGEDIYGDEAKEKEKNNNIIEENSNNNNLNDYTLRDKYGIITNVDFYDKENKFKNKLEMKDTEYIHEFMLCLCLCNTIIIDNKEKSVTGNINYHGSSPDEKALVYFARSQKYILKNISIDKTITLEINDEESNYKLLNALEYSSERKRMSVIVKNPLGKIILYAKGADSMIEKLLDPKNKFSKEYSSTSSNLDKFAKKGLRTLMIAYKYLKEEEYINWNNKLEKVKKNVNHTEYQINKLYDEIEQNLFVLGATAIEDQLQDEVENILKSFLDIGIKVWMLTGDKLDTAHNIAVSCKLFVQKMKIYEIKNLGNIENLKSSLISILRDKIFYDNSIQKGLLISSDELEMIFDNEKLLNVFYEIVIRCKSVVCCRVSPKQKTKLVNLIKITDNSITMAIGDGANDMGMISEANIGIGIEGKEGTQAARASDYSIKQFSHLKKLLFFHGRECYRKNSWVILYNFYKNVLFVSPMIFTGTITLFSGTPIFDPWQHQFYNLFYAILPCFWFGVYNYEYEKEELINNPKYYIQGIYNKLFHRKRFLKFIILGFIEGGILFIFSNFWFDKGNSDGTTNDFYAITSVSYAGIVIICNLKVILDTSFHDIISVSFVSFCIISYYISVAVYSKDYIFSQSYVIKSYILDNISMIVFNNKFFLCLFGASTISYFLEIICEKYPILFGFVIEGKNLPPFKDIKNDNDSFKDFSNYTNEEILNIYSRKSSRTLFNYLK